jgi:hypothetical protein
MRRSSLRQGRPAMSKLAIYILFIGIKYADLPDLPFPPRPVVAVAVFLLYPSGDEQKRLPRPLHHPLKREDMLEHQTCLPRVSNRK